MIIQELTENLTTKKQKNKINVARKTGIIKVSTRVLTTIILMFTIASIPPYLFAEDLQIVKSAKKGNPTLSINQFTGEARDFLTNDLEYSGWFSIAKSNAVADYKLGGDYAENGSTRSITLKMTNQMNNLVAHFKLSTTVETSTKDFIHSAVDELIKEIFNVPGFCSSKLAFVKEIDGVKEIWISDFNGDNPEQFTFNNSLSVEPNWSKDGKFLVYTFYNTYSTDLQIVNISNRDERPLNIFTIHSVPIYKL